MSVAIVTPTHQRRDSLLRVMDALVVQTYPHHLFSAIVVCDGCTDGTSDALRSRRYPFDVTVLDQSPAGGPAAARNRALAVAEAPILLFLDDDVIPGRSLVEIHASHHANVDDVVVIGPLLPPARLGQPWIRWEADTLQKQYREMRQGEWAPTPRQFYTGNASVRTEHVAAAGGFDARFKRGEDVDLAFRLQHRGLRFVFEPQASATHIASRSFQSWVAAAREYGRVELAMGPVWGERGLVDVKVIEFQRRNALVRQTVAYGLRHRRLAPVMIDVWRLVARALATLRLWRLARGAYTAIFELAYWSGVEDAAGRSKALAWLSEARQQWPARDAKAGAHR